MQPLSKIIITEPTANIKAVALARLRGNWGTMVIGLLIMYAAVDIPVWILNTFFGQNVDLMQIFNNLGSFSTRYYINSYDGSMSYSYSWLATVYVLLIQGAFAFGVAYMSIMLVRARQIASSDIFSGFSMFSKTLGLFCYMLLFIFLWAIIPLAGIVLAVIAALRYSQSFYILFDNPDMSVQDIVRTSKFMMDGNKGKLFCLDLSFIGWLILAAVPPAIASGMLAGNETAASFASMIFSAGILWVSTYMNTAEAVFYEMLRGNIPQSIPMGAYRQ
ncbi:MAG: DUF975 family protein [Anaerovoracaceae bacterium]|nr:DUF975 family protein [Anaerovoracaceae bacterium]